MNHKKLVVLDLDNTLLHTWVPTALPPFIAADDPHRTEIQRKEFAARLLAEYPAATILDLLDREPTGKPLTGR